MKQSIEWHEECLKNRKGRLDGRLETWGRMGREIDEEQRVYFEYAAKVRRAKREGRNAFDADKFNKPRGGAK